MANNRFKLKATFDKPGFIKATVTFFRNKFAAEVNNIADICWTEIQNEGESSGVGPGGGREWTEQLLNEIRSNSDIVKAYSSPSKGTFGVRIALPGDKYKGWTDEDSALATNYRLRDYVSPYDGNHYDWEIDELTRKQIDSGGDNPIRFYLFALEFGLGSSSFRGEPLTYHHKGEMTYNSPNFDLHAHRIKYGWGDREVHVPMEVNSTWFKYYRNSSGGTAKPGDRLPVKMNQEGSGRILSNIQKRVEEYVYMIVPTWVDEFNHTFDFTPYLKIERA